MVPFDNSNEVKTKMKEFKWLKRKKSLESEIKRQKYSRLRCLLRVKGLVICYYLVWSYSAVFLEKPKNFLDTNDE